MTSNAERKLTLARVEHSLPSMESPENVKLRLELIQNWALAGLVPGAVAGACVRGCEVWLRAHSEELDRERLRAAERRVRELERELAAVRGRGLGIARG